jgi:hypothetical protein
MYVRGYLQGSENGRVVTIENVLGVLTWIGYRIYNSNMTSLFPFVNKRASYPFDIISLAHAPVNVTDFSIGSINCNPNKYFTVPLEGHRLDCSLFEIFAGFFSDTIFQQYCSCGGRWSLAESHQTSYYIVSHLEGK